MPASDDLLRHRERGVPIGPVIRGRRYAGAIVLEAGQLREGMYVAGLGVLDRDPVEDPDGWLRLWAIDRHGSSCYLRKHPDTRVLCNRPSIDRE